MTTGASVASGAAGATGAAGSAGAAGASVGTAGATGATGAGAHAAKTINSSIVAAITKLILFEIILFLLKNNDFTAVVYKPLWSFLSKNKMT
jgi:hypothetical protein